ncbi:glutaredoxin family protein [Raineyella fluvialis]|nr:glutaredoxin family protein [Raineyella fluvialis]
MTSSKRLAAPDLAVVTIVESEACHVCAEANTVLADLGGEFPLAVERIDARSREGAALLQELRAAMTPLVLLDGAYVSSGRLSRRRLRRLLRARTREAA